MSGASVATITMIEPTSLPAIAGLTPTQAAFGPLDSRGRLSPHGFVGGMLGNFFAHGNASDAELIAASVIALDEDADGVASGFGVEDAGSGADAAFEFVADHSCAAADVAFFDGAGVGGVEGVPGVFGVDVKSVDVVEPAVPGFGDDRQRPPVAFHIGRAVLDFPGDDGVANDADAVRVGDHHGTVRGSRSLRPRWCRSFRRCR